DALTFESILHDGRGGRILLGQQPWRVVDQVYLATQSTKGLRQLAANRSGAQHDQAAWQFGEREHGFVGQVAKVDQARDLRFAWTRSGGAYCAAELERMLAYGQRRRAREARVAKEDVNAHALQPCNGVVMADVGP